MNNLDNAIKSLQGSLHDITSQLRTLEKERKRIERALGLLTGDRPVAKITGVKQKLNYPDGLEMHRRRKLVDEWLDTLMPGEKASVIDFLMVSGEPQELQPKYRELIRRMQRERQEVEHGSTDDGTSGLQVG